MSAQVQQIIEVVRSLSPAEKLEVLNAVEAEVLSGSPESRAELVRSARGKFAHVPFSTEDLTTQKREDLRLEN